MMVVTFSYAAFNTELIITGDALIEAIKEETLATYVIIQITMFTIMVNYGE